jgi:2-polyprenyl-3-methyl-5-hydroxy-6-metoxy-1,4-benzoquinol methylase
MTAAAGDPAAAGRSATGAADAPWSAATYSACTALHRHRDAALLAGIQPVPGCRLLNVGCGVGDLTLRLADLVPGGMVTGIDAAETMVHAAQQRAHRRPDGGYDQDCVRLDLLVRATQNG